jgi:hypothetical protein
MTTGGGMDGWFLGTGNEIDGRLGGRVHVSFGEGAGVDSTITAWEPLRHFAFEGETHEDGSSHAFDYRIEGRDGGTTWIRLVHSGFLPDEGWDAEYDALNEGDFVYLQLLVAYAQRFLGRKAVAVMAFHPTADARDAAVARFDAALGLAGRPAGDEAVRFEVDGLGSISGVVDFVSPSFVGVRTDDALLRFGHTPQGAVFASHHLYGDADASAATAAWQAWLDRQFA